MKTQEASPLSLQEHTSCRSRLWPMCMPSNFPRAAAVGLSRTKSNVSAMISTLSPLFPYKNIFTGRYFPPARS